MHHRISFIIILLLFAVVQVNATKIKIERVSDSKIVDIAQCKLEIVLKALDYTLCNNLSAKDVDWNVILISANKNLSFLKRKKIRIDSLNTEGYQILCKKNSVYIIGGDEKGLMYGILDLRDQLKLRDFAHVEEKIENPRFEFRAIKFNLPWSSYRMGESLQLHMETVKDTCYWEGFLDMMVDNRFNALTLWNLHPFTFMIQPEKFPEATQFTGKEFADWQKFYRTLFRMAKDRGIETYILNWNIITSPQMTEAHNVANYKDDLEWHYGFTPADTSQIIVDYMRECITQVINEYPNLTGVGVSVGERMKMPIDDAMQWIKDTYVAGILQADRKVRFIHRAPFSIHPEAAREYIESYTDFPDPIIMEFKFNWSHGHSTPDLSITHGGNISDQYWNPKPTNYQMAWMMRNEDFLMLNWGNTQFIRDHIAVNGQDFVAGYFVGSETYIPAKEYRMKAGVYDWQYAYEKQWEFYQMWGHLLYNPQLPDTYFTDQFKLRYGKQVGSKMFEALQLSSVMPLRLASFYKGTWDFTLYCEGFLNGKQLYRNNKEASKAFINIEEMITHPTLDKNYLSIDQYTNNILNEKSILDTCITPLELAKEMELNGERILALCYEMQQEANVKNKVNFQVELNDIEAWAHLSLYFSEKLKGGVDLDLAVKTNNKEKQNLSILHLKNAAKHWQNIVQITSQQYQEVSLLHIKTTKFSWEYFYPQVLKDIEIAENALP